MRTLIIDNYDSFTHNLAHYLAEVTGADPVVVRNDDPGWTTAELAGFDNVVISPGPGRPERPADFGICASVIRAAAVPLLGVCLGHQGICHVYGGDVGPAPEVHHGRLSPILHRQADILAGLPSPFRAVRYHSLVASRLPGPLQPIAWAPDGTVMALRHRGLPTWGVQFHPESVCTEYGHRLLRNFVELTRRWQARTGRVGRPAVRRQAPAPTGAGGPPRLRVAHRVLPFAVTAEAAYRRLYAGSDHAFWLDSSLPHPEYGRFSVMGDASGPLARVVTADVWTGRIRVDSAAGATEVEGSFFDWLAADLARHRAEVPDLPFGFALGWVGYLGYELKAECGGERAHRSPHPDAVLVFADRAVVFDHGTGAVHLLALVEGGDDRPARHWFARTTAALRAAAAAAPRPRGAPDPDGPVGGLGPLRLRHDRHEYLARIAACQEAITAGETYEVCLTNLAGADGTLDVAAAYHRLRRLSPAPFAALLRFGDRAVLSSSPERFLRVFPDGAVESRPIKGTRPRSADPERDELLRQDLATSTKDRAENLMIVDLVRNDLATCSQVGSVRVAGLFDVETYATVHQLVSTVRARLRPGVSAVDCVRAAFPGGSMTGAPKIRTMRIIDRLEGGPRGVYSGALGYFSLDGAADLSIVIRTLVAGPGGVEFGVGGAIIALSDPEAEVDETAVKAAALTRLLAADFPAGRPRQRTRA